MTEKHFYTVTFTRNDGARQEFTIRYRKNGGLTCNTSIWDGTPLIVPSDDGITPFFKTPLDGLLLEVERLGSLAGLDWSIGPAGEDFPPPAGFE